MTTCPFCEILESGDSIFQDENVFAFLAPKPAADGHMIIIPKKHYTILEQVPDNEVSHLFKIANKLSVAAFDTLGIGGTNIIVTNGIAAGQNVPHVSIHVIPRNEGDGINFEWQPKQLSQEEMSTIELKLQQAEAPQPGEVIEKKKEEPEKLTDEQSYLVKQLERMP